MTFRLGLTGSIGMGKSTTAQMFRDLGIPVWDADATVHALYAKGGAAVAPLSRLVPDATKDGHVDRTVLKQALETDPDLLNRVEKLVHPLVAQDRARFTLDHPDHPLLVFDIPLLFETGGAGVADAVLVVTTDPETQKSRVMARPGMTEAQFERLLARQMPDAQKRARADHIIRTDTLDQTRRDVAELVHHLIGAADA